MKRKSPKLGTSNMNHKRLSVLILHAMLRVSSLSQILSASVFTNCTQTAETSLFTRRPSPPLTMMRLDFDLPKRTQVFTTIAEISHPFDTLCKTTTFPAHLLDRDPYSSILRLAYNSQNSTVVHAYENALSELLTNLDAVESYGFKDIRDAKKGVGRPN